MGKIQGFRIREGEISMNGKNPGGNKLEGKIRVVKILGGIFLDPHSSSYIFHGEIEPLMAINL